MRRHQLPQDRGNETFYEDATKPGFVYVTIDGDTFTGEFYDTDGNFDFTRRSRTVRALSVLAAALR